MVQLAAVRNGPIHPYSGGRRIGPWGHDHAAPKRLLLRGPDQPPSTRNGGPGYSRGAALGTAPSLEELRAQLERVRRRARLEIAQQLREARSYGDGSNNDEYHAIPEEQRVLEARITSLEQTVARATVVNPDDAGQRVAAIGSTVSIEDLRSGTTTRHRLTSTHRSLGTDVISAASPVGKALVGALPGAIVMVDLPNGRSRSVRLVEAETEPPGAAFTAERDSV